MVLGAAKIGLLYPAVSAGQQESFMLLIDNAWYLNTLYFTDAHFMMFVEG